DLGEPAGWWGLGVDRGIRLAADGTEVGSSVPVAGVRPIRARLDGTPEPGAAGTPRTHDPRGPGPQADPAGRTRLRARRRGAAPLAARRAGLESRRAVPGVPEARPHPLDPDHPGRLAPGGADARPCHAAVVVARRHEAGLRLPGGCGRLRSAHRGPPG